MKFIAVLMLLACASAHAEDDLKTFFCHYRHLGSNMQSSVTLEIDMSKRTVNDVPAMITPMDIQWIRVNARGYSTYYRLYRQSGILEGRASRQITQVTGRCDSVPNR
jgi:hypothetical protein